jgi:predicted MPP superfamily phosphohydrolase
MIVLLSSMFVIHQAFRREISFDLNNIMATIGSGWFYYLVMILFSLLIIDILRLINIGLQIKPEFIFSNYIKSKFIIMVSITSAITFLYILGYLNFSNPHLTELEIDIDKPLTNQTLNITMASDLHLGYIVNKAKLKKYVSMINQQNPDIVLLVGDVVDNALEPVIDQNMHEELLQIKPKYGVYVVSGNHEFIGGEYGIILEYYKKLGWNVIEDSTVLVDNKFYVVGRKDRTDKKRKPTAELTAELDKNKPIILLDHQPFNLQESVEAGVDLQLSGHTHDGQFFPIKLITKSIYEKSHGYLKKNNTNIYVSSGLGLWGPPIRVGTYSELVNIKLKY